MYNKTKQNDMNKEFLHMQKLAGIITESEYKAKLNEDEDNNEIEFLEDCEIEIIVGFMGKNKDVPIYDEVDIEGGDTFKVKVIEKNDTITKVRFLDTGDIAELDNNLFKFK